MGDAQPGPVGPRLARNGRARVYRGDVKEDDYITPSSGYYFEHDDRGASGSYRGRGRGRGPGRGRGTMQWRRDGWDEEPLRRGDRPGDHREGEDRWDSSRGMEARDERSPKGMIRRLQEDEEEGKSRKLRGQEEAEEEERWQGGGGRRRRFEEDARGRDRERNRGDEGALPSERRPSHILKKENGSGGRQAGRREWDMGKPDLRDWDEPPHPRRAMMHKNSPPREAVPSRNPGPFRGATDHFRGERLGSEGRWGEERPRRFMERPGEGPPDQTAARHRDRSRSPNRHPGPRGPPNPGTQAMEPGRWQRDGMGSPAHFQAFGRGLGPGRGGRGRRPPSPGRGGMWKHDMFEEITKSPEKE